MKKTPHTQPEPKEAPLSDELMEKRLRSRRRQYKSPAQKAREQAYADWLEVSLPIDEKKGVMDIDHVLTRLVSKIKWPAENMEQVEQEQLQTGWKRAAGDFISRNAELVSIKNGTALVKVLQPTLRYHLTQWNTPLLEKLQQEFPQSSIKTLKFIFG